MAKRTATSELTQDNWNDETPREEAGTFQVATTEEISQRTVKKAKRRLPEDMDFPSPFQGFSGFGALSKLPATPKLSFDSLKAKHEVTPSSNGVINAATSSPQTTNNNKQTPTTETELSRSEYLRQLCCLNESLVSWISQHVKKNPYCLLTPVFSDYNKHMEELERKYKGVTLKSKLGSSQTTTSTSNEESRPLISGFRFGDSSTTKLGVPTLQTGSSPLTFNFFASKTKAADEVTVKDGGALVKAEVRSREESGSGGESDNEHDDDNNPKENKIQEVKENDAFYSKRCKLFYKKDTSYVEKGVGTLYLKSTDDTTQLLIRAETNLGNILLNIRLTSSIPVQRLGKNNVSLVCIPNPPLDTKTTSDKQSVVTFLIRVKTTEDADELFATLDKHKV